MPADLPANRARREQFVRALPALRDYSVTEKIRRVQSPQQEKNVQLKYRLYRRRNGNLYWQENGSKKQGSLRTTERREAERLLNAMNESHRQPTLNLNLARAYRLSSHRSARRERFRHFPKICRRRRGVILRAWAGQHHFSWSSTMPVQGPTGRLISS